MKFQKRAVAALVFAIFTIGAVESLLATPDGSQRLRGLEGRTFEVMVMQFLDGELIGTFKNCYAFQADGVWNDPLFPVPGSWEQHTNGASTTYSGEAYYIDDDLEAILLQEGSVTPAEGSGVLQLQATSEAVITFFDPPFVIVFDYLSVGFQNDDCTL
jgi:hypothetical protein